MANNPFSVKQNELIESNCGIKFNFNSDKEVLILFSKNGVLERKRTNRNLAALFFQLINLIYDANSNLICQYSPDKIRDKSISFAKRTYDLYDLLKQHEALWIIFQKTAIKIQISMSFKNDFIAYYLHHIKEFDTLFNTDEDNVNMVLNGSNNNDKRPINKITSCKSGTEFDWLNFNLVNADPLPLLFDFIRELDIIRP